MKLDNDINHEWFSVGPGGHLKGKNDQSEGGSSPEEGGGDTIIMTLLSIFFQKRLFTLVFLISIIIGERARED